MSTQSKRAYEFAYKLACEQLVGIRDLEQQCLKSGTRCLKVDSGKVIEIEYLNQSYLITLPDIKISLKDSEEEVPQGDRILMLHYFIGAKGTPPSNKPISFKELRDGAGYFPTFSKRAIKPLLDHFGEEPHRLLGAADMLGGRKVDYGDAAVTISAFNRVPLTLVLWRGDEEFPPAGNIMFDSNISDYLPTEDIIVLCQTIAWRLVRILKAGGGNPGRN